MCTIKKILSASTSYAGRSPPLTPAINAMPAVRSAWPGRRRATPNASAQRSGGRRRRAEAAVTAAVMQRFCTVPVTASLAGGSPRTAVAASGFEDPFDQLKQQFTDRENVQTAGIKREQCWHRRRPPLLAQKG